jgi:hypothetical protein
MAAAHRGKTVDKQDVCKKLHVLLKKHYPGAAPKSELPVLETLLYAVCLEDSVPAQAEQAYARMLNGFHDLNEVRVSSIYELEAIFEGMEDPAWRALRLKNVLQFVFESTYSFDFDGLKRKPTEQAVKMLTKIPHLSAFVRHFSMQSGLGMHVLPIDQRIRHLLVWLGLVEPTANIETAAEALRSFVRKADAAVFCHLLRMLATDPKYVAVFEPPSPAIEHFADEAIHRLEVLFKQGAVAAKKLDAARIAEAQKANVKPVKETAKTKEAAKETAHNEPAAKDAAPKSKEPAAKGHAVKEPVAKETKPAADAKPVAKPAAKTEVAPKAAASKPAAKEKAAAPAAKATKAAPKKKK